MTLFAGRPLKNTTRSSPGNPVEVNQSDDDLENPEVLIVAICIRHSANGLWV